jgi:hypothetical protein
MKSRVLVMARRACVIALVGLSGCDCGGGGFPDARPSDGPLPGTITATWSLTDLTGAPITCDQVGATTVFLQLRSRTTTAGAAVSLSCALSPATSQPLVAGIYDVTFELHAGATTIATGPAQNAVNVQPGLDTRLAPVAFMVDSNGGLIVSLAAPPVMSNCDPVADGGAGITTNTITLEHTGDGCAPVVFTRSRGATVLGTYTVSCSAPMVTKCIESDEQLAVASMPSGPYTIHIRGKVNALDCWQNDDSFQVPALGKVLSETRNLAFRNVAGCMRP